MTENDTDRTIDPAQTSAGTSAGDHLPGTPSAAAACGAWIALDDVLDHMATADARNGRMLAEMNARLAALAEPPRPIRPAVPAPFSAGFERIEGGMALLAHQLAEAVASLPPRDATVRAQLDSSAGPWPTADVAALAAHHGALADPAPAPHDVRPDGDRLAAIEAEITALAARLGDEPLPDVLARVATRTDLEERAAAIEDMIAGYVAERRAGEDQSADAIDTLQQAMVRVLDRLDVLEADAAAHGPLSATEPDLPPAPTALVRAAEPVVPRPDDRLVPVDGAWRLEPATAVDATGMDAADASADPISRQREMLQASVQRAAAAQREKQHATARAAGPLAGLVRMVDGPLTRLAAAVGRRRTLSSCIALAVAAGFAAATLLNPAASPEAAAELPTGAQVAGATATPMGTPAPIETAALPMTFAAARTLATTSAVDGRAAGGTTPDGPAPDGPAPDGPALDGIVIDAAMARALDTGDHDAVSTAHEPAPGTITVQPPAPLPAARTPATPAVATGETVAPSATAREMPPATVGPLSLRLAAADGDPSAAFEVGTRLAEGRGTDQNLADAARWFGRAAATGFAPAQYRLATLAERGLGIPADPGRAGVWYHRAAEQGHVKAMHNLAVLLAGRSGGGAPDYEAAAAWFTKAAGYGLADSQFNLAVLLDRGLGVPKDAVAAAMWAILAADGGDRDAIRRRDEAKVRLDRAQWATAEQRARSWRPQVADPVVNDPRVAGDQWRARAAGTPR